MKKFKKSLILMCCLSGFSATGLPSHLDGGIFMKEIKLCQGKPGYPTPKSANKYVALVDDEDYEYLNQFRWGIVKNNDRIYAQRMDWKSGKSFYMHRVIMGVTERWDLIDHKDHDTLNNQKHNLRKSTSSQNNSNRKSLKGSSSKYLGVSWSTKSNIWQVHIMKNNKSIYLGKYNDEQEAAKAYDAGAKFHHGEFANLNFK